MGAQLTTTPSGGFGTYLPHIKAFVPFGNAGDRARLQAAGDAVAGRGELLMRSGTALINAPPGSSGIDISGWSNTTLDAHPNLRLLVSATAGGGAVFNNFGFKAFPVASALGTLSVAPVPGAMSISTSAPPQVGSWIYLRGVVAARIFLASIYKVRAVAGAVVTLDRPIKPPFSSLAIGDSVTTLTTRLENFVFEGNGCRIDGTGDRLWEVIAGHRVYLRNVRFGPNDSGQIAVDVASYDISCLQVGYDTVDVDGIGLASGGLMFESVERGEAINCNVKRCGDNHRVWDSRDVAIENCNPSQATNANILLDSNAMAHGCHDVRVTGGTNSKSANIGIAVVTAADTLVEAHRLDDNPIGAELSGPSLGAVRTTFVGTKSGRSSTHAIRVGTSASGTRIVNHQDSGGGPAVLQMDGSDVDVNGLRVTGAVSSLAVRIDGGTFVGRGLELVPTGTSNTIYQTGGDARIEASEVAGPVVAINCAGGVMRLDNVRTTGAGVGVYNSAGFVHFGSNDFSGSTTPMRNDNGAANVSHSAEMRFSEAGVLAAGATVFLGPKGASLVEAEVQQRIERATTFREIAANLSAAVGGALTLPLTVRKNGADTALVLTLGSAAVTGSKDDAAANATNVAFAPGDLICVKVVVPGGSVAANPRVVVAGVGR